MESDGRFYELRVSLNNIRMNAADFRRIALSLEGAEEGSHMGAPDFRVDGRIFATLASESEGYGNLMLTPEQQADFVNELPQVFLPIKGGLGKNGDDSHRPCKSQRRRARGGSASGMEAQGGKKRARREEDKNERKEAPRQIQNGGVSLI